MFHFEAPPPNETPKLLICFLLLPYLAHEVIVESYPLQFKKIALGFF